MCAPQRRRRFAFAAHLQSSPSSWPESLVEGTVEYVVQGVLLITSSSFFCYAIKTFLNCPQLGRLCLIIGTPQGLTTYGSFIQSPSHHYHLDSFIYPFWQNGPEEVLVQNRSCYRFRSRSRMLYNIEPETNRFDFIF